MLASPKTKTSQTVWAAKWEHKHGEDISIHTTQEGAQKQLVAWARETLEDWSSDPQDEWDKEHAKLDDENLIKAWTDITGGSEFLYVEDHVLHSANVWEEVSEDN
mgnify:CR=1 FL=1